MENHKFWNTQPVDVSKNALENKSIKDESIENIKKNPINLPNGFEWTIIDINNDDDLNLIYEFLLNYYNDDINVSKRFHYQKEFLRWFLTPPGYYPDLLLGVKYNNKLLATIFGVPMTIKVHDKIIKMVEINFLCIHHSLRNKRLTPVLIKEVTRRTNLHGIFQAFYTANHDLPNTIFKTSYYHKLLNIPKLVDIDYIQKPDKISMQGFAKYFKIKEFIDINIRKIETTDMEICCKLLNEYHNKFKISILFSLQEFIHQFTFRENIIETYVVENNGKITDMLSFYFIPSKLNKKYKYTDVTKAYIYYYFYTQTDLVKLVENGIYLMKKKKIDMINLMKQYDNDKFIDTLKFNEGNIDLNFYFYNWQCPQIEQNDMAIVMV